jgi:hypothetical protein
LLNRFFKEIKHIKDEQSDILWLLRQQAGRTDAENVIIEDVLEKPCENEEQLLHLNIKVENEEFRSKLVSHLLYWNSTFKFFQEVNIL